ncbi:MAG TPA: T9SS type A sorting domain-containing protein, partial [Chitinophagales bacterium]|nr:T9SS type A sorting domain-containing protein [Chitinophagales bacterium]
SIINLPEGLTWSKNPSRLNGGQNGCLNMTGTTTAPTGRYNLLWYGTIWATLPSPIPAPYNKQTYTGVLNQISGFDYYLDVINQGDACHTVAGIRDFNKDLNVIMQVFPNPTSGKFQINLNAGSRINGQIVIMDMTGREVYTKNIDLLGLYSTSVDMTQFSKGLYVLQLRTAQGVASRRISVE